MKRRLSKAHKIANWSRWEKNNKLTLIFLTCLRIRFQGGKLKINFLFYALQGPSFICFTNPLNTNTKYCRLPLPNLEEKDSNATVHTLK